MQHNSDRPFNRCINRSVIGAVFTLGVMIAVPGITQAGPGGPQTPGSPTIPAVQAGAHHGGGKLAKLAAYLGLTEDQKERIKPLLKDEAQQIKPIKTDTTLKPEEKREKIRAIHESFNAQILSILTLEQREKLKAMHAHAGKGANPA